MMPTAAMGFGDFEPLSFFSLRLTLLNDQTEICTATGFTVRHDERDYLITNYHVLSGRNVDTGQPVSETTAVIPTHVAVDLHRNDKVCRWIRITLPLLDDEGQPRWINHPSGVGQIREEPRRAVDVVALPIDLHDETMLHRVPIEQSNPQPRITVTSTVYIVGFPMGASVGRNFPIWLTGTVANDPIFNYDDRPVLLVDARTRPAMSGSPVWAQTDQTYINGRPSQIVGPVRITAFVGIYSGRIHKDLDIGFVWKPYVLREVLTGVLDPNAPAGRFNPVDDDDWLRK